MKVAIIGSRTLHVKNLEQYLPQEVTEIVSGGARGIDTCAKNYAVERHIQLTEFLPNYGEYGKSAPLKRNLEIIQYADMVIAFWDGKSHGTKFVIDNCRRMGKEIKIFISR